MRPPLVTWCCGGCCGGGLVAAVVVVTVVVVVVVVRSQCVRARYRSVGVAAVAKHFILNSQVIN